MNFLKTGLHPRWLMAVAGMALLQFTMSAHAQICPGGPGEGQMQIGVARGAGGAPICGPDPSYRGQTYLNAVEGAARDREVAAQISSAHRRDTIDFLTRAVESTNAMRRIHGADGRKIPSCSPAAGGMVTGHDDIPVTQSGGAVIPAQFLHRMQP